MNITIALDVATGLVLLYLILSLLCTTLNELIAGVLKLRSRNLQATIQQLIDDPNLRAQFYNHGLISSSRVAAKAGTVAAHSLPTVERAPNFFQRILAWFGDVWSSTHPSYLNSKDVATALVDLMGKGARVAPENVSQGPITLAYIRSQILSKPPSYYIDDVLSGCVTEAENDLNKLRDTIAAWFDSAMDRLSGAYKRKLQWITLAVAFVVAVALNADTIHVARALWQDPPLAAKLSQSADTWSKIDLSNPDIPVPANSTCQKPSTGSPDAKPAQNTVSSTTTKPAGNAQTGTNTNDVTPSPALSAYRLCLLNEQARAFPIGWTELNWKWAKWPLQWERWQWINFAGILMTAIALSLGAPFWFDFLGKLVNLRSTGRKPDSTKVPT